MNEQPPPDPPAHPGAPTPPPVQPKPNDDSLTNIIPYRNVAALVGYYLGVFSLIPCLGIPLAVAAIVMGIIGWSKRARIRKPEADCMPGSRLRWAYSASRRTCSRRL